MKKMYLSKFLAKEQISHFGFPTLLTRRNPDDGDEYIWKKFYQSELKELQSQNYLTKSEKMFLKLTGKF